MVRAFLLIILAFGFTANAEFRGTLASWEQLKQMTPKQRRAYMDGYRKLVMIMAEQDHKLGLYADNRDLEFSEQVAIMMNYFSIMPTAEAEDAKRQDRLDTGSPRYPNWVNNYNVNAGAANGQPQQQQQQPPNPAGWTDGYYGKEADKLQQTKPTGSEEKPGSTVPSLGGDNCPEPPDRACGEIPDRDKKIEAWRDEKDGENTCIIGGFFSTYKSVGRRAPGKCKEVTQFPVNSSKPGFKCDKPKTQTMCNPFVFCVIGKDKKGNEKPDKICVEKVSNKKDNVTERCEAEWNKHSGKCMATDFEVNGNDEFSVAWREQKAEFEKNFNRRCFSNVVGKSNGFEALFCDECNRMKKILYGMNKEAIKFGCASKPADNPGPAPAAPPTGAPPAGAPPAAPGAPGEIPPLPSGSSR